MGRETDLDWGEQGPVAQEVPEEEISSENKASLLQMRLKPKTKETLENLAKLTGVSNKTQVVTSAIFLAEEIVRNLKNGGKVYVKSRNGKTELLKFVGV